MWRKFVNEYYVVLAVVDDVIQEAVSGANITSYYLKKLQPCSTYRIFVSIISANGESQKSDPIYATTKPSGKY